MINDVLKKLRTIYGYKAVEMSRLLEISPSYLSEIENGKKQPSLELLKKYSEIFEIKLSSLILLMESYDEGFFLWPYMLNLQNDNLPITNNFDKGK